MSDRLLTVPQVAATLGVSRVTVYGLFKEGQLASLKIGKSRRVPSAAVDAFIRERLADQAAA